MWLMAVKARGNGLIYDFLCSLCVCVCAGINAYFAYT